MNIAISNVGGKELVASNFSYFYSDLLVLKLMDFVLDFCFSCLALEKDI